MNYEECAMQTVLGLLLLCSVTWTSESVAIELEASMHSSVLLDMETSVIRPPSDAEAVVGMMFKMRIPGVSDNCHSTNIFEADSARLPAWLHWDSQFCLLQGLPLDGDKGLYRFTLSRPGVERAGSRVHSHLVLSGNKLSVRAGPISREPDIFTISVNLDDQKEIESVSLSRHSLTNTTVCVCSSGQTVTVLTVILDVDLTKINSKERLVLLQKMSQFASEPPELLRVMPVINNRFFDMTAFMAGPGNAKKVVENGALLSWKLGCALDLNNLPDISGVQLPAKDGTMSKLLGYPVVGWYIVNKKTHVVKRIRRQLYNTPTPMLSQFPPTTHLDPAERIVPLPTSPYIAGSTHLWVNLARGPLPLPVKPTLRLRDQVVYTPVLGHPLPTRLLEISSIFPIKPTPTHPSFVEQTASITPPTTRRPKTTTWKKDKVPVSSKESKTTDETFGGPSINQKPLLHNPIDELDVWVGTYFEMRLLVNAVFEQEDGSTEKLRLSLHQSPNQSIDESSWIQFNNTSRVLYGLPNETHVGRHRFLIMAIDEDDLVTTDAFEVLVHDWTSDDQSPVIFAARFQGEARFVTSDIHKKILLSKKLASALGDRNVSSVRLKKISSGSILVEWTNNSLPTNPCPAEQIQNICHRISDAHGRPTWVFQSAMEPDFKPIDINVRGVNKCLRFLFVPPQEESVPTSPLNISKVPSSIPPSSSGWGSSNDVYLHTVIPTVVVAALLLTAGFIAMVCYRRKRHGKLITEEQANFIRKGVPIIFADEMDDAKSPTSSSIPLILREEKPPLPPPQYSGSACGEGALLNHILEEYVTFSDDDQSSLPYQRPPPFTFPIEGRGSRPKNMTNYRCPPPYVPP